MIRVDCQHCGTPFEVADSQAGGLANCPSCGKATSVSGLNDPYFRMLQAGMAVGLLFGVLIGWLAGGWIGAIAVGVIGAIVIGLMHLVL